MEVVQRSRLRRYGHVLRKSDDDFVNYVSHFRSLGAREGDKPSKTRKVVVGKDVNDLYLKSSVVMDRCKRRKRARWNWSDSNSASDAVS